MPLARRTLGPVGSILREADRRHHRWKLMTGLWKLSTLDRVKACTRTPAGPGIVELGVCDNGTGVRGVQRCSSIHVCPWCMPKIRAGRADEIRQAGQAHVEAGGELLFGTFTVPHDAGDSLDALWSSVAGAWRTITASQEYRALKLEYGHIDYVRAIETNIGANGWHPHVHVLFFLDNPTTRNGRRRFGGLLRRLWSDAIEAEGWRRPDGHHGVRIDPVDSASALAGYLGKIDAELARSDLKEGREGSRSPLAVLAAAIDGEAGALELWHEYEKASHGKRAITWSRGLKKRYGVGELTDVELAEREVEFETVLRIQGGGWWTVCAKGYAAQLQDAVLLGDQMRAIDVLAAAGVTASVVEWLDVRRSVPLGRVLSLAA